MKTISVKAVKRADFGKKAAKAIRREGMVPCVLCGNGETETFSVDPREIKPLIYTPELLHRRVRHRGQERAGRAA